MTPQIIVKEIAQQATDYKQVYALREEILRKPIGLSLANEDLSGEAEETVLAAMSDDEVIGCIMIKPTSEAGVAKFRQMAVAGEWQGKDVGKILVSAAENHCRAQGDNHIVLHARVTAQGFYSKLGYDTTSEEFTEVGIPHVIMEKKLS